MVWWLLFELIVSIKSSQFERVIFRHSCLASSGLMRLAKLLGWVCQLLCNLWDIFVEMIRKHGQLLKPHRVPDKLGWCVQKKYFTWFTHFRSEPSAQKNLTGNMSQKNAQKLRNFQVEINISHLRGKLYNLRLRETVTGKMNWGPDTGLVTKLGSYRWLGTTVNRPASRRIGIQMSAPNYKLDYAPWPEFYSTLQVWKILCSAKISVTWIRLWKSSTCVRKETKNTSVDQVKWTRKLLLRSHFWPINVNFDTRRGERILGWFPDIAHWAAGWQIMWPIFAEQWNLILFFCF